MYRNALFFADRLRSCIWALLPDASGIPKKGSVVPFAGMAKRATDLEVTPPATCCTSTSGVDTVQRIRYTLANKRADGGCHGQRDVRRRTARGHVQRARLDRPRRG